MKHTYNKVAIALIIAFLLLTFPAFAQSPQDKSIVASANGEGLVKVGQEEFKVTAVTVKLKEDGVIEINLVSEITVFVSGTWSNGQDAQKGIDVSINGGASNSSLQGDGKLFLRDDRKSIASLKLSLFNKTSKRAIEVTFVGK